jgi:hypothetical protein
VNGVADPTRAQVGDRCEGRGRRRRPGRERGRRDDNSGPVRPTVAGRATPATATRMAGTTAARRRRRRPRGGGTWGRRRPQRRAGGGERLAPPGVTDGRRPPEPVERPARACRSSSPARSRPCSGSAGSCSVSRRRPRTPCSKPSSRLPQPASTASSRGIPQPGWRRLRATSAARGSSSACASRCSTRGRRRSVRCQTVLRPRCAADLGCTLAGDRELPRRQRKALLLREFSGLSYGELAVALGVVRADGRVAALSRPARSTQTGAARAGLVRGAPRRDPGEALMGWGASKVAGRGARSRSRGRRWNRGLRSSPGAGRARRRPPSPRPSPRLDRARSSELVRATAPVMRPRGRRAWSRTRRPPALCARRSSAAADVPPSPGARRRLPRLRSARDAGELPAFPSEPPSARRSRNRPRPAERRPTPEPSSVPAGNRHHPGEEEDGALPSP